MSCAADQTESTSPHRATWTNPGRQDGKKRVRALLLCASWLLASTALAAEPVTPAEGWRTLLPGLSYRQLPPAPDSDSSFTLHVFRLDLKQWRPVVADARQKEGRTVAPVDKLASELHAPLVVNGSFFDEQQRPLGLLVDDGREIRPLRRADWGVLYVRGGQAHLVHTRDFRRQGPPTREIDFAIQVGPRLVAEGQPLHLKPQWAERVALGILHDGALVVVASAGSSVESNELAQRMAAPVAAGGLGCRDALMMDGGPSAQLHARAGTFELDLPGVYGVPIGVAFLPRASGGAK